MTTESILTWKGQRMADLSREELLDVIDHCAREISELRADRARWRSAASPMAYLMAGKGESLSTGKP